MHTYNIIQLKRPPKNSKHSLKIFSQFSVQAIGAEQIHHETKHTIDTGNNVRFFTFHIDSANPSQQKKQ